MTVRQYFITVLIISIGYLDIARVGMFLRLTYLDMAATNLFGIKLEGGKSMKHELKQEFENSKRRELIDISLKLLKLGLVVRTWGNMSIRLDENHILITPSGIRYEDLEIGDIVCVEIQSGKTVPGSYFVGEPSSELPVHLAYYRAMPETEVVLHTHQMYGSALSLYGEDIAASKELSEQIKSAVVPISDYGISGSHVLHENVEKKIKSSGASVILMEKHGVLARGESADDALAMLENLEKWCKEKYENIWARASKTDRIMKELYGVKILPYLDDFAQICGVSVNLAGVNDVNLNPKGYVDQNVDGSVLRGVNPRDLDSAKYVFRKNMMARLVGIAQGVPPLSYEEAQAMRRKYTESYSMKADIKGKQ